VTESIGWGYWYIFPIAVLVAITANASGFSGGVLFQPFFNFALGLPLQESIATGVATETIGMTSGASRYLSMHRIDQKAAKLLLPAIFTGVGLGLFVFIRAPRSVLRLVVGVVVGSLAIAQLYNAGRRRIGVRDSADLVALRRFSWVALLAGGFSACTGTGVAEMDQPLLEYGGGLTTKRANATAIFVEAAADWAITLVNLSVGNLRLDILLFSAPGVLIGAQFGALVSPYLPDRLLKTAFGLCVLGIGLVYVGMAWSSLT